MSAGRPRGSLNDEEAASAMRAAQMAHEEEMHLRAIRSHRRHEIATVRLRHLEHHMSRKRLIEIYGQDLVDEALAPALP